MRGRKCRPGRRARVPDLQRLVRARAAPAGWQAVRGALCMYALQSMMERSYAPAGYDDDTVLDAPARLHNDRCLDLPVGTPWYTCTAAPPRVCVRTRAASTVRVFPRRHMRCVPACFVPSGLTAFVIDSPRTHVASINTRPYVRDMNTACSIVAAVYVYTIRIQRLNT